MSSDDPLCTDCGEPASKHGTLGLRIVGCRRKRKDVIDLYQQTLFQGKTAYVIESTPREVNLAELLNAPGAVFPEIATPTYSTRENPARAHARNTDPGTSHEAAESVVNQETVRVRVLHVLRRDGPMHDADLLIAMRRTFDTPMSDSGIRTRRRELCDLGLIRDTNQRTVMSSGRKAIIWEAV